MPRRLLHLPRHTLRLVLIAGAVIVFLYFGLTRTQVGRDGLRLQLQRSFAQTYEGRLEIGLLKGNLVQTLFAGDVRLYGPDDQLIVSIDSLIARPSWRQLFGRRLVIRSLTLVRPSATLRYGSDSTWNLTAALRRKAASPPDRASPWRFESADLRIIDGAIRTSHEDAVPPLVEQGRLFNYADATLSDLQLRSTVEWSPTGRFVDVLAFSAVVPEVGLTLNELRGQIYVDSSRVQLAALALRAGRTDLALDVTLNGLHRRAREGAGSIEIDAEVQESRIDADQWRRLFPELPVSGLFDVSARLRGRLAGFLVEALSIRRGASSLALEGSLLGLPDSLDFQAALGDGTLAAADLRGLLPAAEVERFDHLGPIRLRLNTAGVVHLSDKTWRTRSDLRVQAAAGSVAGTLTFDRLPGEAVAFAFDLRADSLDLGALTDSDGLSTSLNGRLSGQGRHLTPDSLASSIKIALGPSLLAGRQVDTLHVDGSVADRRWEATVFVRQGSAGIYGSAELDLSRLRPLYRAGLVTRELDLSRLIGGAAPTSDLNASITLEGSGRRWRDVAGSLVVRLEPSTLMREAETDSIPAQRLELVVHPSESASPRATLAGDALRARYDGSTDLVALSALADLWRLAFEGGLERLQAKPYLRSAADVAVADVVAVPALDIIALREEARAALREAGMKRLTGRLVVDVLRAELLTPLLPSHQRFASDGTVRFDFEADADRMRIEGHARGSRLATDALEADRFDATVRAGASLDDLLENTLQLSVVAVADSVRLAGQTIMAPHLTLRFEEREGSFSLNTDQHRRTGPLRLAGRLTLLPDRNRLTLTQASIDLDDYRWATPEPYVIDHFQDAVVVPGLRLTNDDESGVTQQIRLHGVLSAMPQDTIFVEVERLGLRRVSASLGLKQSLGGLLNGRLALTNSARPELTGTLVVDAFALDDNLLGHLTIGSRYVPGMPDVALDVRLRPEPETPPDLTYKENHLNLAGTFRLPAGADPGALDLRLEVRPVDAFFLEYIVKDVSRVRGAFIGNGAIRGTFARPRFEADLLLTNGRFDVPQFNLSYLIDGNVQVDDDAIRLNEVRLNDPTGGAALLSGALLFNEYRFLSFDLSADLEAFQIIDVANSRELPFYGFIWATGRATLTGPLYNALLRTDNTVTTAQSEIYIPLTESAEAVDPGFIVFTDSTGRLPDFQPPARRANILASRPEGERTLTEGLDMDLNIFAPQGSTVHLVIDPLLGDVINAVGSGRLQLQRTEGDFATFGTLNVEGGDYLFTAGEVFVRRFTIEEGTIAWDGDPLDARLNIDASYRTRASGAGLPSDIADRLQPLIPLIVRLRISGRVSAPLVALSLAVDRNRQEDAAGSQFLETYLNQPDRAAQHATSVLLTNSFLLTTEGTESDVLAGSAFNSVSQLVSSQLNRYLSQVVPNADFSFGVQSNETAQDLDVTAGLAIRLLNERLVIRGQGVYRGLGPANDVGDTAQQGLQGEFVVEVRLSPSVSVEVFYRREGDVLSESLLTNTTGAGLSYQTQFPTWRRLLNRILGRSNDAPPADAPADTSAASPVVLREP